MRTPGGCQLCERSADRARLPGLLPLSHSKRGKRGGKRRLFILRCANGDSCRPRSVPGKKRKKGQSRVQLRTQTCSHGLQNTSRLIILKSVSAISVGDKHAQHVDSRIELRSENSGGSAKSLKSLPPAVNPDPSHATPDISPTSGPSPSASHRLRVYPETEAARGGPGAQLASVY